MRRFTIVLLASVFSAVTTSMHAQCPGGTPTINAGPDRTICAGQSVQLNATASNYTSVSWSPATGLSATNILNPTANPTTTTTYVVTATNGSGGNVITYSQNFTNGVAANGAQCTAWNNFRALLTPQSWTRMTVKGTFNPTGITCTDPVVIGQLANGLNTLTSVVTTSCGGQTWSVCGTRYSGEFWLSPPSLCSGSNCPSPGYIIRPCITNSNWGGVNTATCGAPSQNMTLEFESGNPACTVRDTIVVTVVNPGSATFSGLNNSYCGNAAPVTLTPSTTGGTFSGPGVSGSTFNPATAGAGTHTITYTIGSGSCVASSSRTVTVNAIPVVNAGPNLNICTGQSVTINATATNATTYAWTPTTGLSSTTILNPVANPATTTNYIITAYNNGGPANVITYSDTFTTGVTPTTQCSTWNAFRALLVPQSYTRMTVRGTFSPAGVTCTDPVVIGQIANALNTLTSIVTTSCGGQTWSVCGTRYSGEFWLSPPSLCSGANCPSPGYLIRPCIGNLNWGGVNTATCSAPTQRMILEFEYGGGGCSATDTVTVTVGSPPNSTFSGLNTTYCVSSSPATLTPVNPGGTFSGRGVTGNTFNPAAAGPGTHTITYSLPGTNCTGTSSLTTTVNALPDSSFTLSSNTACVTSSAITLTPTTTGGTFSGPGVAGNFFNPSTAGLGTHTITYTVTVGICTNSSSRTITVDPAPDSAFTLPGDFCTGDNPYTMMPNTPGGTFTGPGVSGSTFTPSVAGAGTFTITYSVTVGGCTNSSSRSVNVGVGPGSSYTGLLPAYCTTSPPSVLIPSNTPGYFYGTGVTGFTFYPANAGPGQHTISYTMNFPTCRSTTSFTTYVTAPLNPSFTGLDSLYCLNYPPATLTPVSPGGTFAGPGASGTVFVPATAGLGRHNISYTVVNGPCTSISIDSTTVLDEPVANFTANTAGSPLVSFADASTGPPDSWSWDFGDGGTSTLQNPSHTYTLPGTYTVTLSVTNFCGTHSTSNSVNVQFVSVSPQVNADPMIEVYPNPSSGQFTVTVQGVSMKTSRLEIMNLEGKVLMQENCGGISGKWQKEVRWKDPVQGVYLLRISDDEGNSITRKIIVE